MTTFTDGPAAGVTLALHRAPLFLRVVESPGGKIDALDQLNDEPQMVERLFAYEKTEDRGNVHVNARDSRGRRCGGWFPMATYRLMETQPDDATMRGRDAWQEWCRQQVEERSA